MVSWGQHTGSKLRVVDGATHYVYKAGRVARRIKTSIEI